MERFLADANIYMEMASTIVIAWQWMKQAVIAKQKLVGGSLTPDEEQFYESKLHTFRYFYAYELPKTAGFATILLKEKDVTVMMDKEYIV